MAGLKGTKTEKNLLEALAGESMARNKYTYYEEKAREDGEEEVAELFARMARNECAHAKIWFRLLHDGIGDTDKNIQEAAGGENQEWRFMYPDFAKTAREEGLDHIAAMFERVAAIEKDHEYTFLKTYAELKSGAYESPQMHEKTVYRCTICGASYDEEPEACDTCGAVGYFKKGTALVMG